MECLSPELLDRLAADYVLGTLGAAARRRFQAALQQSASAADAVRAWERRMATLAINVPPLQPSADVWERVSRKVQGDAAKAGVKPLPRASRLP